MSSNADLNGMSPVELESEITELELRLKDARSRLQDAGKPSIRNLSMNHRTFLTSRKALDPNSMSDIFES
jgi:hypothetical protein